MPSHPDFPVVVITGASSGIGRATAHAFARQGATVVLAARRAEMLREVERECLDLGGRALAVPTDTTEEDQVERLASMALEHFGRIDVWFNNAGVGVFGRVSSDQTRCSKKTPTVCEPTNYCPRCDALTCPVCT